MRNGALRRKRELPSCLVSAEAPGNCGWVCKPTRPAGRHGHKSRHSAVQAHGELASALFSVLLRALARFSSGPEASALGRWLLESWLLSFPQESASERQRSAAFPPNESTLAPFPAALSPSDLGCLPLPPFYCNIYLGTRSSRPSRSPPPIATCREHLLLV